MIKTAWRSISKTKSLSVIHISGLGIAIAAATILFLTAMFELSFDSFHKEADRIALLYNQSEPVTGPKKSSSMPVPLAPQLKTAIPSIDLVTRYGHSTVVLKNEEKEFVSTNRFVDVDFLTLFSFPLIAGNETALDELDDLVITADMAKNLFGSTDDVVGRQVQVNNEGVWQAKTVSAVLKNIPSNSSLQFETLMRYESIPRYQELLQLWDHQNHQVFVRVKADKVNEALFSKEVKSFTDQYFKINIDRLKRDGGKADAKGNYFSFHLLPLSKLHLNDFGFGDAVSTSFPWILLLISGLILFIASSNFINLSLANSMNRNREIGTRKTLGGTTVDIVKQLWLESMILCVFALVVGLALVYLTLPEYNAHMNYRLELSNLFSLKNSVIFVLIFFTMSLIAGGLPALKIARSNIVESLKRSSKISASRLQSSLTVLQFIVAITLIIATIVISSQLNYLSGRPLGFNKNEVISIPIGNGIDQEDALNRMRITLHQQPWVKSVTASDINLGRGHDGSLSSSMYGFEHENKEVTTNFMRVDYDYLNTLDIPLLKGRDFDRSFGSDSTSVIINKQMAAQLGGVDHILGKTIDLHGKSMVIGIMDDFNYHDLKRGIEPLTISINPNASRVAYIFVRVETKQLGETLEKVEGIWKGINPKAGIPASYLNENTQNLYQSDRTFSKIIISGTTIAIVISCLGLFALALLTINRRVKEIGIRKVLGSSVSSIIILLSRDFIQLVILAFIIATPVAWLVMNKWLQTYAYRIQIQWWMVLGAGCLSIIIAWLTIAWQAFRVANANPINSLRDE
ncbi:MAG: ABC transporter permease [Sphingobacteriaceae bacterium]